MKVDEKALVEELELFGIDNIDEMILSKLKELCIVYGQTAESVVCLWIAFATRKNLNKMPTEELLLQLEREDLAKATKVSAKTPDSKMTAPVIYTAKTMGNVDESMEDDVLESYGGPKRVKPLAVKKRQLTPEMSSSKRIGNFQSPSALFSPASFSPQSINSSAKYCGRTTSGDVVCQLLNHENIIWNTTSDTDVTIKLANANLSTKNPPYMFEKLRDKMGVLNDIITDKARLYSEHLSSEEWSNVKYISLEDTFVTGRICCDSSGRINASSLILESNHETSIGYSVPLDVSSVPQYSLFPGQVIAGRGINSTGTNFVLKEIFPGKPLPFNPEPPFITDPLHIVVAAGPFTTSDTLSFEPMADLMKYLSENQPHVCILVGPFVDSKHELVQKGCLPLTYEEVFLEQIEKISEVLQRTRTELILIPSQRDIHHDFVYPSPPFKLKQKYENIRCAPDPCTFEINGVVFGVTSADILFHLGKEEFSFPPGASDRLGRLTEHVLLQHSFYPMYPPSEEMNIDYPILETYGMMTMTPHVLILPSDLRSFVKEVHGCVCINPERLSKGLVGGSFARVMITPCNVDSYGGSMSKHISAEVVKI